MLHPYCLIGLPPSLSMWLGKHSAVCVARIQQKLLWSFFFSCGGVETLVGLCIVSFSFLHQAVSAKGENCVLSDQQLF